MDVRAWAGQPQDQGKNDALLVTVGGGLLLTALVAAGAAFDADIEELLFGDGLGQSSLFGILSTGDAAAAALWSISLWFVSPAQLLLLFLGRIETQRPSDWLMAGFGRLAGLPVDELGYKHPPAIRALAGLATVGGGLGVAVALQAGLGDATWGVSSGIATCMAAGVYELGRPTRLSSEQAIKLEGQWQTFAVFAEERLQRGGRCHESEIWKAFEAANPSFRAEENKIDEQYLRDMVANWCPAAQRTPSGYYKNISLKQRTDPFSGARVGQESPPSRRAPGQGPS